MLTQGYLFEEVSDRLNISVHTVNTYVRRIYEKLHVRSRARGRPRNPLTPGPGRGQPVPLGSDL